MSNLGRISCVIYDLFYCRDSYFMQATGNLYISVTLLPGYNGDIEPVITYSTLHSIKFTTCFSLELRGTLPLCLAFFW